MSNKGRGASHSTGYLAKKHRADIDGLRAVAIAGVLAYHFGLGVPGGYGGVDVFFVISGFLITGIIKSELEAGTFSLAQFYVRRIRRILPALTACLLATTIAATFILFPHDFKNYGHSLLSAAMSASNFYFMGRKGYFDDLAIEKPLLHTWSLGVEEQFYAVFPVVLILLFAFSRKSYPWVLAVIIALSFAYSCYGVARWPEQAFFSTLGRAWELGLGVIVAFGVLPLATRRWVREVEAASGALLIGFSYLFYSSTTPFPGFAAVPLCVGAALIVHSGLTDQTSIVAKLLSSPPAVRVGLISYSIYLWHWPLLVLALYRFPEIFGMDAPHVALARLGLITASICLGAFSWRFIEEPFRRSKALSRNEVYGAGAAATLTFVALSVVISQRAAWLHNWPPAIQAMQFKIAMSGRKFGLKPAAGWPRGTYVVGKLADAPDTVLWGDSFAQSLTPGFITYHQKTGQDVVIAADAGCPPLIGIKFEETCTKHNDAVLKSIAASAVKRVILVARWFSFEHSLIVDRDGKLAFGGAGKDASGEVFGRALGGTVRRLAAHGKRVVIIGPIPRQSFDVSPMMAKHVAWGTSLPPPVTYSQFSDYERFLMRVLSGLAGIDNVRIVYPHLWLCDVNICGYGRDGKPLYTDYSHLSPAGVAKISDMFVQIFEAPLEVSATGHRQNL